MAAKPSASSGIPISRKRTAKRSPWIRRIKITFSLFVILVLAALCVAGLKFISVDKQAKADLDSTLYQKLNSFTAGTTVMLARDGKTVLYTSSAETRDPVDRYDQIPQNIINATLAAEDKRFFEHHGVDYVALVRSTVTDVRERRSAQGGSTITMQLVKRLYTSSEKTLDRKLKDVALAMELEKRLSKQEILKDYLNQVYYGQGAYGIKAASEVYFGKKDLNKLTIGEAALLARLVRRPSDENPFKDRKKAISNRNDVLGVERDEHMITAAQYSKAVKEKLHLAPKHFGSGETIYAAPYFVRYVLDCLKRDLPDIDFKSGGYTIETTLDPDIEKTSEHWVKSVVAKYRRSHITTGAFMLMNANGEILSMVGGTNFEKHQFNAVVQGHRQPGSSFKPIVYSTALSLGAISPSDYISGAAFHYEDPYTGKPWDPENDNGFIGPISIQTAIAQSINTAAARVCQAVGPDKVVAYAHDIFGYTSPIQPVLSIALGSQAVSPLEQAQAYSIFMLHGDRATPFGVLRVIDANNNIVKEYAPDIRRAILDPEVATQMDQYLRAVVTSGTATRALAVRNARGKTGTTQDFRDAWFCGYTNNLVGIAWVANEKYDPDHNPPYYYDPMLRVFGGHVPTEIWVGVMKAAEQKYGYGSPQPAKHTDREDLQIDRKNAMPLKHASDDASSNDQSDTPSTDSKTTDQPNDGSNDSGNSDQNDNAPKDTLGQTPADSNDSPPPRRHARRDTPDQSDTVTVEVCADTGLLATRYCPETVTRTYIRGQQPTRYCTKHGP